MKDKIIRAFFISFITTFLVTFSASLLIHDLFAFDVKKTIGEQIIDSLQNEKDHWVVRSIRVVYFPDADQARLVDENNKHYPEMDDKASMSIVYDIHVPYAKLDVPYERDFSDDMTKRIHKEIMKLIVHRLRERWNIKDTVTKEREVKTETYKDNSL